MSLYFFSKFLRPVSFVSFPFFRPLCAKKSLSVELFPGICSEISLDLFSEISLRIPKIQLEHSLPRFLQKFLQETPLGIS